MQFFTIAVGICDVGFRWFQRIEERPDVIVDFKCGGIGCGDNPLVVSTTCTFNNPCINKIAETDLSISGNNY